MLVKRAISVGKVRLYAAVVAVGLLGNWAANRAAADTFTFQNVDAADTAILVYAPMGSSSGGDFYAGQYSASLNGGPSFYTFCVDLVNEVGGGETYPVNFPVLVNPNLTGNNLTAAAISYLYRRYGEVQISNNDTAAALQLAIWDELANGGAPTGAFTWSLTSGNQASVTAQVDTFLSAANSFALLHPHFNALYAQVILTNPPNTNDPNEPGQSFLVPGGGVGFQALTPEPASMTLACSGAFCLAGFFGLRRRRDVA